MIAWRKQPTPKNIKQSILSERVKIVHHYSAPELEELIAAANRVCEGKSGKTPALVVLRQTMAERSIAK